MDREAYVEKLKAQIDQWNHEIDKMQASARAAQDDARRQYEAQLAQMRTERDKAEAKMREARAASEKAWQDMSAGMVAAWESIGEGFRNAMKRF
ncbi:MAG: sll1863 family stress response protein [Alkalilacustris sp.]